MWVPYRSAPHILLILRSRFEEKHLSGTSRFSGLRGWKHSGTVWSSRLSAVAHGLIPLVRESYVLKDGIHATNDWAHIAKLDFFQMQLHTMLVDDWKLRNMLKKENKKRMNVQHSWNIVANIKWIHFLSFPVSTYTYSLTHFTIYIYKGSHCSHNLYLFAARLYL